MQDNFDDIRPYYDSEIPDAMDRIARSPFFESMAAYVYPGRDVEEVRQYIRDIDSIDRFQFEVMYQLNKRIIAESIDSLTYSGLENITPENRYLFVSNHRDIMLDSCLLEYILYTNGHTTSEITFGSNLMCDSTVIDIGRSNKMFRVEREGTPRQLYEASMRLSQYIRHTLTARKQSVWIAQRGGRTKDGNDRTEPGLLRMFASSQPGDPVESLASLNIAPVSVSYQYEPCDVAKAVEMAVSKTGKYIKKPGEDIESVLNGIISPKGNVHIHISKPLTSEILKPFSGEGSNTFYKQVAAYIDCNIHKGYRLHSTNYIAKDILEGSTRLSNFYTNEQFKQFERRLNELPIVEGVGPDVLRDIFLHIYAIPVDNHFNQ